MANATAHPMYAARHTPRRDELTARILLTPRTPPTRHATLPGGTAPGSSRWATSRTGPPSSHTPPRSSSSLARDYDSVWRAGGARLVVVPKLQQSRVDLFPLVPATRACSSDSRRHCQAGLAETTTHRCVGPPVSDSPRSSFCHVPTISSNATSGEGGGDEAKISLRRPYLWTDAPSKLQK